MKTKGSIIILSCYSGWCFTCSVNGIILHEVHETKHETLRLKYSNMGRVKKSRLELGTED